MNEISRRFLCGLTVSMALLVPQLAGCAGGIDAPGEDSAGLITPVGHQPFVVLLCRFNGYESITPTITPNISPPMVKGPSWFDGLFGRTFTGDQSLGDFIYSQSYGTADLEGTRAYGWFNMGPGGSPFASRNGMVQSCIDAASANGLNLGGATRIAVMFNIQGDGKVIPKANFAGATWGGGDTVTINGQQVNINETALDAGAWQIAIAGQETLHGLGLYQHAWSQEAGHPDREYGDKFDVMGNGGAYAIARGGYGEDDCRQPGDQCWSGPNLSAAYRDVLGWLPRSRVYTYGSASRIGEYEAETVTLSGIDRVDSTLPLMVRIPLDTANHYLTAELRLRSGWDRGLPAAAQVLVKELRQVGNLEKSFLPVVSGTRYSGGRYYLAGEVYQDALHNIDVTVQSIDAAAGTATLTIQHETPSFGGGGGIGGQPRRCFIRDAHGFLPCPHLMQ